VPVDSIPEEHTWLSDLAPGFGVQNCGCKRASGGRIIRAENAKTEILDKSFGTCRGQAVTLRTLRRFTE